MTIIVVAVTLLVLLATGVAARTIRSLHTQIQGLEASARIADIDPDRDPLTGVGNWAGLLTHLRRARARRSDSDDDIAIVALDIGEFGALNASLGGAAGDVVLRAVAHRLQIRVRSGELLARTSGARFVVALEAPITAYGARRAAGRFVECMREPLEVDGAVLALDAYVGIAVGRRAAGEILIEDAQDALMKARQEGAAHPVLFSDSLRRDTARTFHQAQQLKTAVASDELYVAYQPIHRTQDGAMTGVEALLRWDSRTFGPVSPVDFIPIAEDTGAIIEIGAWVLQKACEDAVVLAGDQSDFVMSVNVSTHQMKTDSFHELVESVLISTDLPPESLQIEITESTLARPEEVEDQLERIRALGVRIALDDVGTGYSSLAQIAALRVDAIKLDRSLKNRNGDPATDGAERVFTSLAALGQSLGLDVIAEGIETTDQARLARGAGCSHEQGFLYSKPIKLEQAIA
jgi:diguanylate cyclase (GGDEF)-like protein